MPLPITGNRGEGSALNTRECDPQNKAVENASGKQLGGFFNKYIARENKEMQKLKENKKDNSPIAIYGLYLDPDSTF